MAVTVDSADFLIREVLRDLKSIEDKLIFAGSFYLLKTCLSWVRGSFYAFKIFGLSNLGWRKKLNQPEGCWALLSNCHSNLSQAFAHELAAQGVNIALISGNETKAKSLARSLETKYQVSTAVFAYSFETQTIPQMTEMINRAFQKPVSYFVNNKYEINERIIEYGDDQIESFLVTTVLQRLEAEVLNRLNVIDIGVYSTDLRLNVMMSSAESAAMTELQFLRLSLLDQNVCLNVMTLQPILPIKLKNDSHKSGIWNWLFYPDGRTYARSALAKLGWTNHTTGFWTHALVYFILQFAPKKNFVTKPKSRLGIWTEKFFDFLNYKTFSKKSE